MVFFETPGKPDAIEKKALEFNEAVRGSMEDGVSDRAMSDAEVPLLKELIAIAFGKDNLARPSPEAYTLLSSKLLHWPTPQLFPILDVIRMLALNAYAAKHLSSSAANASFNLLLSLAASTAGPPDKVPAPTRLMALRLYTNCFRNTDMRSYIAQHCGEVLASVQGSAGFSNAQVQLAYASLLLNIAVHSRDAGTEATLNTPDVVQAVLSGGAEFLHTPAATTPPLADSKGGSEDAVLRVLCALGTLLVDKDERLSLARELRVPEAAGAVAGAHGGVKVKECAQQLLALFAHDEYRAHNKLLERVAEFAEWAGMDLCVLKCEATGYNFRSKSEMPIALIKYRGQQL
eukprot:CAMPEP_0181306956 /NCGR_PEP_ID=MMETSP1101-20121128/10593_1 /TAXON_ID=46948 /ORGANISM="Rhodomonas abbreviata, Strain Caron Lab Isolate" /LENGTH=345 /DNA_ID=CAMNT_0023413081 /DNA_START=65 /DNA_END=1103 /DNA_ORIENTATION=+